MKRWFLKGVGGPWYEVTEEQWRKAERAAGFTPTAGFGTNTIEGRYVDDRYETDPHAYDWDPAFRDAASPGVGEAHRSIP